MRRSALALGAAAIALALTAGPAAADTGVGQTVDDSTGAAQIGAVAVDAPVRVASDGDGTTVGASAGGPQTTGDSTGSAQVTSIHANAPVRVLSDGNDTEGGAPAGGTQSTGDSEGSAQVGAAAVDAPVRVASDGDNSSDDGAGAPGPEQSTDNSSGSAQVGSPTVSAPVRAFSDGDNSSGTEAGSPAAGSQTVTGSTGAAQVGSPTAFAPVRVLSGGTPAPGDLLDTLLGGPSGGGEVVASPSAEAPAPSAGDTPSPDQVRRLIDRAGTNPAIRFASGGTGASAGAFQTLGVSASSLPLTGFGLLATVAMGVWMFSTGLALRLVPGGKRR